MRFEMAKALVRRARERAVWIGDDHGDPYEEALLSRLITTEMGIAVKEILDHLRAALDYAAREICETCGAASQSGAIYFPIVSRSFDAKNFRSRVGKLMPGVLQNRPDLVPILESFQPFASDDNGWLADLATLSNETKHVQLKVTEVSLTKVKIYHDDAGQLMISKRKPDGKPFLRHPLMFGEGFPPSGVGEGRMYYISLMPIDEELLYFLKASISGVESIIEKLEGALAAG